MTVKALKKKNNMAKPFKMKGCTLPGIKKVKASKSKDGRSGSSAFQYKKSAPTRMGLKHFTTAERIH